MLQFIRERFTGVVAIGVIGVIGLTLVISFGNMDQGGVTTNAVAEVNGEEIGQNAYQRAVQNQLARQLEAFQGNLPEVLQEQIKRNVLEALVRNKVVTQYVHDSGFRVGDNRLLNAIGSEPAFQVGGAFSRESYLATLASQGFSPEYFESEQRAQLAVQQFEDSIVASSFFTPSEFRRYIKLLAEVREATIMVLEPADIAVGITVNDKDLQVYYEANPDEFREPESVSLEYVEIQLDDIAAEVSIDEQVIQDYYQANADRYVAEEQRQGRHILIAIDDDTDEGAARTLAGELHQRILDGEQFADLAGEYSDDSVSGAQGGDLGWAGRGDNVEAFETALFELEMGAISAPVRTEFGYHIIRLDAIRPGSLRSFAEVHDELRDELTKQESADLFYALAEQIDDLALENPTSLDVVESETGIKVQRVEQFTRNGGPPFGYNALMVDAVFSLAVLEDGENSPLIETAEDSAVILRVAEHRPSVLQPLTEIRERVEASVQLQQAGDIARERGEEILTRLKTGLILEDIAAEYDIEVLRPGALRRSSNEIAAELLAEIYRAPHPDVDGARDYRGMSLSTGGYAVFRLDKVEVGRADTIPREVRDQRKQLLAQQFGNNTLYALIADLREQAKVIVAPNLFDQAETF
ncbi:MAG: SurA N-terminal domain-containing protein [Gammaproteobacteria bacterium]|jgi:peptidyl-prolyl cis-trans isomerase D|nr:SurA N-terminal domain-containing protein [Gammaproteobacteria bacterium]MDP7661107.1 SurA N-terminal domain-containing protein [Gammaproteobacteria bacterium]HJP38813.1 SurA N-terminal domain-containing protein [Gammaproteobacteria bacterium]